MYDPALHDITHCIVCHKVMLIDKVQEPVSQYILDLGFKESGRWICGHYCLSRKLDYELL